MLDCPPRGSLARKGRTRILIAEDDPALADGLRHTLRQCGYAVDWAKDGTEADAALGANDFDLLILDVGLPEISGFEVLKRLRARNAHLPVLMLTALGSVSDRVRGLDAGADDYLAKPFQLAELEARARALTRRGTSCPCTIIRHGELEFDQVGRVAESGSNSPRGNSRSWSYSCSDRDGWCARISSSTTCANGARR